MALGVIPLQLMRWLLSFSIVLFSVPAWSMEPHQLQASQAADPAYGQEEAALNASSQQLKSSSDGSTSPLLQHGPQSPSGSSLLNLNF
jgi:hypothetical protein